MKISSLLALLCLLAVGCMHSANPPQETGRDLGGQTQGGSFPGSSGAGSLTTTGSGGGGRSNGTR